MSNELSSKLQKSPSCVVFHGSFSLTSKSISFQIESLIIFFRQKKLGTNFRLLSATPGERHRQVNFPIRAPIRVMRRNFKINLNQQLRACAQKETRPCAKVVTYFVLAKQEGLLALFGHGRLYTIEICGLGLLCALLASIQLSKGA